MLRRFTVVGILGALLLLLAVTSWYLFWPRPALADREENITVEFPTTPPALSAWTAVPLFPKLQFAEPVGVMPAAGQPDRLFVLERQGRIMMVTGTGSQARKSSFLDISAKVFATPDGDNGALGLAFHPRFGQADSPQRGYFYLFYSAKDGGQRYNRLSRFNLPDDSMTADPASELVLINQSDENQWHDGGPLAFGPDGFLYIGVGDEGHTNDYYENGQRIDKDLFSGILRIDVDCRGAGVSHPPPRQPQTGATAHYFIPDDNPFVGMPNALEEFWSIGLRNPYRISFDPATGNLWAGDVGQNLREEVLLIEKGSNHGWSYSEGSLPYRDTYLQGKRPEKLIGVEAQPVLEYPHVNGNNCVIGGYVYRGRNYPELQGKYIFGDNVSGRVWALDYDLAQRRVRSHVELLDLPVGSKSGISTFGLDSEGELLICTLGKFQEETGTLLRLVKAAPGEGSALPKLLSQTGIFSDLRTLTPEKGVIPYDVNSPLWSDGAIKQRWMIVPGNGLDPDPANDRIAFSAEGNWTFPVGTVFVKHFDLPLDEEDATQIRRLETRILVRDSSGCAYGFTYKWNAAGDDAELLSGSLKEEIAIRQRGGGTRVQTWLYPGPNDCLACHTVNSGVVLGVKTSQLNGSYRYPQSGVEQNQLVALNRIGLFHPPLDQATVAEYPQLVPLSDTCASLETRVRSYLDANCGSCHRPGGIRANFDARFETSLPEQGLIDGPLQKELGISGAKVVRGREVQRSMLVLRMLDATHKMPPLGSNLRDVEAIATICEWIDSLPPAEQEPTQLAP